MSNPNQNLSPLNDDGDELDVSESTVPWNELFTRDVIDHKKHQKEGGLGQWEYSDPKDSADPVRGSSLWIEFLRDHPEYYIPSTEMSLAFQASFKLPRLITEPIVFAFLGMGNKYAFKRKDLALTKQFRQVVAATCYDISIEYLNDSIPALRRARPSSIAGAFQADIFKPFDIPIHRANKAKRLATLFGLTLFNTEIKRDANRDLIRPDKQVQERLRAIRSSLQLGDFFVTTHDGNMDQQKVERAYAGQADFACNLAHRIKRDTPYKTIRTDNEDFRVEFDQQSGILCHYLTLDFNENGGAEEYLINVSPKYSREDFEKLCESSGFTSRMHLEENGVYLHALEAVEYTPGT